MYISYFYNVRFFRSALIPVSTAVWDPKWFHNWKDNAYVWVDNNGVINGVRCEELSPSGIVCDCTKECKKNPKNCEFLSEYRRYLYSLDFKQVIDGLRHRIHCIYPGAEVCLMVYETPDNKCSERTALVDWFKDNGEELIEWRCNL